MRLHRRASLPCFIAVAFIAVQILGPLPGCAQEIKRELPSTVPPSEVQAIHRVMDQIKVPEKTFTAATAGDILAFLDLGTMGNDGKHVTNMVVSYRTNVPVPRITVRWKHLNWRQALDDFCQQTDLYWKIEPTDIFVAPREVMDRQP